MATTVSTRGACKNSAVAMGGADVNFTFSVKMLRWTAIATGAAATLYLADASSGSPGTFTLPIGVPVYFSTDALAGLQVTLKGASGAVEIFEELKNV